MTVNDFISDLAQLGETLSNPQELLAELGDNMVTTIKTQVPVDTGALRNSIQWSFTSENAIQLQMLNYGVFQNYGVMPSYNPQSYHKPFMNDFGTITQPMPAPGFGLGTGYQNRAFGLPARKFYDELQIQEYIGAQFLEDITVNF
jgi:hypothetical protein